MRWAIVEVDCTYILLQYEDSYDYDLCGFDGLYSWRMYYQEDKPSELGQELIQATLDAFQGDLTLEEDGELLLETLKQEISRRLLTAKIKVVQ